MSNLVQLPVKRRFYTELDNGLTFFWLKRRYGVNLNSAIAAAIRIFYLPSALGASMQTQDRVMLERQNSIREFEKWMNPKKTDPLKIHIPKRVEIETLLEFPDDSDNGKTLAWMLQKYGGKTVDEVIRIVQLTYLPSALEAFPEHKKQTLDEVHQSRTVFCDARASDVVLTISEMVPAVANGKPPSDLQAPPPILISANDADDFDLDLDAIYKDKED